MSLQVFDRQEKKIIEEKVFGGRWIDFAYGSRLARALSGLPAFQRNLSRIWGAYQTSGLSKRSVPSFVKDYGVKIEDFEEPPAGWQSFNDFFVRHFLPGKREFPKEKTHLGAMAEGRLSVFKIEDFETPLSIKGVPVSFPGLIGGESPIKREHHSLADFVGGYAWVFRLCPLDYHRFHFPDSGFPTASKQKTGQLHSVNPAALKAIPDLYLHNERQVTGLHSDNFGAMLIIEVGAMCVGRIQQTFVPRMKCTRGSEKGYFEFGGSTVILLTERGQVVPDADLIERTQNEGIESLVRLGETIGRVPTL